jgi:hypothetical protein
MAITSISRDWGVDPQIVRIVSTDSISTITAAGYLASQAANIKLLQNGAFQWRADDSVLISYNGGNSFFNYNLAGDLLVALGVATAQLRFTAAQILGMYATPLLVIPAPLSSQLIVLGRITGTLLYGSAQFASGGALGLEWGNVAHAAGPAASSTLAAATLNGYAASNTFELTPDNTDALANTIGLGVYLSNATGAFTTGDSTLLLNVNYQVTNAV